METYPCNNKTKYGRNDCEPVKKQFDICSVCKAMWKKSITIKSEDTNPHLPDMYQKAVEIFLDRYHERLSYDVGLYTFKMKLVKQEYIYYDFGERNYWEFKFKAKKI